MLLAAKIGLSPMLNRLLGAAPAPAPAVAAMASPVAESAKADRWVSDESRDGKSAVLVIMPGGQGYALRPGENNNDV